MQNIHFSGRLALTTIMAAAVLGTSVAEAQRGNPGSRTEGGSRSDGGSRSGGSKSDSGSRGESRPSSPGPSSPRGSSSGSSQGSGGSSRVEARRDPGSRGSGGSRTEDTVRTPREPGTRGDRVEIYGRDRDGSVGSGAPYERRGSSGTFSGSSVDRSTGLRRDRSRDIFTRSVEGRRFDNGIVLRPGTTIIHGGGVGSYFYGGVSFFGGWNNVQVVGTYWSPYGYYSCLPVWVQPTTILYAPPSVVYIERRDYDDVYDRSRRALDDYYLNRREGDREGRGYRVEGRYSKELRDAIEDIREAFRSNNIQPLVNLTDTAVKINVIKDGKYQYSINADEYLDITRDMLKITDTLDFDVVDVVQKADTVAVVTIRHSYTDRDHRDQTVYATFALERLLGKWILTQVGTAPARRR